MAGKRPLPTGHVVLDIEIARSPEEVGGWEYTGSMCVGCAVIYEVGYDRYHIYDPNDLEFLHDSLANCDRITTWGGWNFDFPVIYGLDRTEWKTSPVADLPGGKNGLPLRERSVDLLRNCWLAMKLNPDVSSPEHSGWKLEEVGEALTGIGKAGDGASAVEMLWKGRWGELVTYCQQDVWLTNQIERFIRRHGFVINKRGRVVRFAKKTS